MPTVTRGSFEWDDKKAAINKRKHNVTFEEAISAFFDERAVLEPDPQEHQDRFVLIGMSNTARILYVVHADIDRRHHAKRWRLISARVAKRSEAVKYALGDAI